MAFGFLSIMQSILTKKTNIDLLSQAHKHVLYLKPHTKSLQMIFASKGLSTLITFKSEFK